MSITDLAGQGIDMLAAAVFFAVPVLGVDVQLIVIWLAAAMLFATFHLGMPQFRGFTLGWALAAGRYADPGAPGGVTPFRALTTALASTVGLGNIAGVAVAVALGGPGAVFWMILIGVFAMALKCAEVTLGLMYREVLPDGRIRGGPAITLLNGLRRVGRRRLGLALGRLHAVFMIFGCLSLFQVNQSWAQWSAVTGMADAGLYGVVFALAAAVVLLGSIAWIGRVTSILVPAMCAIYLAACFIVLGANAAALPAAVELIVVRALAPEAVAGGAFGAFVVGMRRAVYSSESGIGTAVVAHVQARTREPASEGMVALIEPFIDTVVVCTITGLTLVVTGMYLAQLEGVQMTSAALATALPAAPAVLAVVVLLFGYSTVVANGFYAAQAFQHLVGHGVWRERGFKLVYCSILPLGALLDLGRVIDMVDSFFFLMAVPNIIGLYLLAGPLRREMRTYLDRMRSIRQAPAAR